MSQECVSAINDADHLVVPPWVLAELVYLMQRQQGHQAAVTAMRELSSGNYDIPAFGSGDVALASDVMTTYADLNLGLVDASLVVLAKRYRTHDILTLDQRHFRVVRSLEGRPFRLLPFDIDEGTE